MQKRTVEHQRKLVESFKRFEATPQGQAARRRTADARREKVQLWWAALAEQVGLSIPETRLFRKKWQEHKENSRGRNIGFFLTFEQWIDIWKRSGQLNNRGARRGSYVMSRPGDQGVYEISNVKIILFEDNLEEELAPRRGVNPFSEEQIKKMRDRSRGRPITDEHRAKLVAAWKRRRSR